MVEGMSGVVRYDEVLKGFFGDKCADVTQAIRSLDVEKIKCLIADSPITDKVVIDSCCIIASEGFTIFVRNTTYEPIEIIKKDDQVRIKRSSLMVDYQNMLFYLKSLEQSIAPKMRVS
jgi:hypothetical protein